MGAPWSSTKAKEKMRTTIVAKNSIVVMISRVLSSTRRSFQATMAAWRRKSIPTLRVRSRRAPVQF